MLAGAALYGAGGAEEVAFAAGQPKAVATGLLACRDADVVAGRGQQGALRLHTGGPGVQVNAGGQAKVARGLDLAAELGALAVFEVVVGIAHQGVAARCVDHAQVEPGVDEGVAALAAVDDDSGDQVDIAPGAGEQGAARVYEGLVLLPVTAVVVQGPSLGELTHLLLTRRCS